MAQAGVHGGSRSGGVGKRHLRRGSARQGRLSDRCSRGLETRVRQAGTREVRGALRDYNNGEGEGR